MRIVSWNVNGVRAAERKGFLDWLKKENADIVCLQETKAHPSQLSKQLLSPDAYWSYWHLGEKKGYSGVGLYTKQEPIELRVSFGIDVLDHEGRTMMADFGDFVLLNLYCPNGKKNKERLEYKMRYYDALLEYLNNTELKGKKIILCGDFNTAHKEIDLARPKENAKISGFRPEERAWIDRLIHAGFVDTLREFHHESGLYTWWDMKIFARERNVGWRIDYFFITENLRKNLKNASIENDVYGSDHCPISIEFEI